MDWRSCLLRPLFNGVDMAEFEHFIHGDGDRRQALVVVFLRGGADGLNMVAPLEDDGYYRARPRMAIAKPRRSRWMVSTG